jgi:hypothetical protein
MHGWRTFQAWACMVLCWAASAIGPSPLQAQEFLTPEDADFAPDDSWLPPSADTCCGPKRKTLLQWSYGASFGGGPNLDEPLVTDRPDFTEASSTVGRGVAQLEFGYTYFHDSADGESTTVHSIGEPLLRYGFGFDWLELRVAANYLREVRRSDEAGRLSDGGPGDLYLGVKIGLTPQEGILPEMALVPQMFVPIGSEPLAGLEEPLPGLARLPKDRVLPGLNWLYGWDLTERFSLGGSTIVSLDVDPASNRRYTLFAQSLALGFSITERLGGYVEWYALMPSGAEQVKPEYYFNGGPVYLLTNNLQLDFRAGLGLNEAAQDYFLGTGASVRF